MRARLMIAPARGGGTCFAIRWGINGGGMTGCPPPRRWEGPPLQVYFNEPRVLARGPSLFLAGRVRPDIATLAVHLPDGHVLTLKPNKGFVLIAVPVKYAGPAHKGSYAVGFDSQGRPVARGRP